MQLKLVALTALSLVSIAIAGSVDALGIASGSHPVPLLDRGSILRDLGRKSIC